MGEFIFTHPHTYTHLNSLRHILVDDNFFEIFIVVTVRILPILGRVSFLE